MTTEFGSRGTLWCFRSLTWNWCAHGWPDSRSRLIRWRARPTTSERSRPTCGDAGVASRELMANRTPEPGDLDGTPHLWTASADGTGLALQLVQASGPDTTRRQSENCRCSASAITTAGETGVLSARRNCSLG